MTRDERRDRLVVVYTKSGVVGHLLDVRTGWTACGVKAWRTHRTERVPTDGFPCRRCVTFTRDREHKGDPS